MPLMWLWRTNLTTLLADVLRGAQKPRLCSVPGNAVTSDGTEAIELCEMAGLRHDEWQQTVLLAALGVRADGKWNASAVGLNVPRQNGKGSLLEARELAGFVWHIFRLMEPRMSQGRAATASA